MPSCMCVALVVVVQVIVTAKTHSDDAEKMKAMMHRISPAVVRDRLSAYLKLLKEGERRGGVWLHLLTICCPF